MEWRLHRWMVAEYPKHRSHRADYTARLEAEEAMLTIRLFVEGARHAGTSTVMRLLAAQVSADLQRWQFEHSDAVIEWMSYSTNSTTGEPIRLEVTALSNPPASWVDHVRSESDAIVLVADSTRPGVQAAQGHLRELAIRLNEQGAVNQALFGLLAHHQDRDNVLSPADVAAQLGFDAGSPVAGTSRSVGGVQYGIALIVRSVVRGFEQGIAVPHAPGAQAVNELVDAMTAIEPAPSRPVVAEAVIVEPVPQPQVEAEVETLVPAARRMAMAATARPASSNEAPASSGSISELADGITMAAHASH
jgi:hypothetical protein